MTDEAAAKVRATLPRGLVDRAPADIAAAEAMMAKIRAVYELYGFEAVETPFIEHTEAAIAAVSSSPERWPILEQDIRRRLTRIFPFAILYTVEEDYVLIVAVMHCHRKPGYWHMRVGIPATK